MTKELKAKLLYNLKLKKSIGYDFCDPINIEKCTQNKSFRLPNSLVELKEIVKYCSLCDISKSKTRNDFSQGNENSKIIFVDLTSSIIEDSNKRLILGKSGDLLIKMIETVLLKSHEEFYFTNIIKCKTSICKDATLSEVNSCKMYLNKQFEIIKPKLIVALGESCFYNLINTKINFEQIRGKIIKYNGIDLLPIYHPSFLLRNPSAKKEAFIDMLKIKSLMESM